MRVSVEGEQAAAVTAAAAPPAVAPRGTLVPFLLVGVINTAVGMSVIFGTKALLGWGDLAANMAGYAVGITVSFTLNKRWTFRHDGPALPAALRFLATFALAYVANLAALFGARDVLGIDAYVAQLCGMATYTTCFYLLSRHFAFARRVPRPGDPR